MYLWTFYREIYMQFWTMCIVLSAWLIHHQSNAILPLAWNSECALTTKFYLLLWFAANHDYDFIEFHNFPQIISVFYAHTFKQIINWTMNANGKIHNLRKCKMRLKCLTLSRLNDIWLLYSLARHRGHNSLPSKFSYSLHSKSLK